MDHPELYDLHNDLGEDNNVAAEQAEKLAELQSLYTSWAATLETPRWTEGHSKNTTDERAAAAKAGTRQYPMPWLKTTN